MHGSRPRRGHPGSPSSTGSSTTSTTSTTSTRATGRACRSPSTRTHRGAALADGPSEIALFQHEGGEKGGWDDSKVQKEGTHPVVYPAAGSHATFYGPAVYVENGQGGSGLGCDNTTDPLRRVEPRPVLIPTHPRENGPFKWLTFVGHWGEKEKGYNNGPQGPIEKLQWNEPFTWMAGVRTRSPELPSGFFLGPQVTGAFCGTVKAASGLVNLDAQVAPCRDRRDRRGHPPPGASSHG